MYCLGRLRRKLSVFTVSRLQVGQPQNKSEDMHENVWATGGGTVVATFMIFPFFMMVTSKFPNRDIKSCLKTTKSKSLQNHQRITTELLLPSHSSFKWGCNDTFLPLTVKMYCLGRLRRKLSVFTVSRLQVGQPQNKSEDMHENVWTTGGGTVVATFMIFPFFMMVTSKFPNLNQKKLPENDQVKITSKSSKNDSYHLSLVLSGVVMILSSFNCENVLPWQTAKKALRVHGLQVAGWAASKQI